MKYSILALVLALELEEVSFRRFRRLQLCDRELREYRVWYRNTDGE